MKTIESVIENMYLIDVEGAQLNVNEDGQGINRSKIPFARMKTGKFRKLFHRHDHVFNRLWTTLP
jgi:hypothetical protein